MATSTRAAHHRLTKFQKLPGEYQALGAKLPQNLLGVIAV